MGARGSLPEAIADGAAGKIKAQWRNGWSHQSVQFDALVEMRAGF